jgi:pyrroline-5-carboxylate reductase
MTVAILGVGVMGETLLSGLIRGGRPVDELLVGEKRAERAAQLTEKYGVRVLSNVEAVSKADTVALVVKPQDMAEVLEEISSSLTPGTLLVSLAAGITTDFIESRVPDGIAVVRVMPNTPALVDEGMAAISRAPTATTTTWRSPSRCSGRPVAWCGCRRSSRTR